MKNMSKSDLLTFIGIPVIIIEILTLIGIHSIRANAQPIDITEAPPVTETRIINESRQHRSRTSFWSLTLKPRQLLRRPNQKQSRRRSTKSRRRRTWVSLRRPHTVAARSAAVRTQSAEKTANGSRSPGQASGLRRSTRSASIRKSSRSDRRSGSATRSTRPRTPEASGSRAST